MRARSKSVCLIFLGACSSSAPPERVFKKADRNKNSYFVATQAKGQVGNTPFDLFLSEHATWMDSQKDRKRPQALYLAAPPTLIHGDFHPLQTLNVGENAVIANFGNADFGPWFIDVLRMETGAAVLAAAQSLKLHEPGACIDAYRAALTSGKAQGKALLPADTQKTATKVQPIPCDRAELAKKAWDVELTCTNAGVRNKDEGRALSVSDFTSEQALANHMSWMCSRAALAHAKGWGPNEIKALATNLNEGTVFRERLKTLAQSEATALVHAHRMLLQERRLAE